MDFSVMKERKIILALLVAVLFTAIVMVINDTMISIRLDELREILQEQNRRDEGLNHIGLVSTYEINKKLFENRITQEGADALESRIDSVTGIKKSGVSPLSTEGFLCRPVLALININRFILGKSPLSCRQTGFQALNNLDLAYYHERNFSFRKAIELYNLSLKESSFKESTRAGILLHQGYCYALSQMTEKAKNNYTTILEKYSGDSRAITALVLLRYLDGFRAAGQEVLEAETDSISKGRKLLYLLDYSRAHDVLEGLERSASPGDRPRIGYYMARCFAGMGEVSRAAEKFLEVIASSPSSEYARYSNRRLFIIGRRSGERNLVDISVKLNSRLKDPEFERMMRVKGDSQLNEGLIPEGNGIRIPVSPETEKKVSAILTPEEKPSAANNRYMVISTSDGNIFRGTLVAETPEHITLKTLIGEVNIKRDRISGISDK
jgi:tetratricopeptide (TPR) repeat protein